MELRRCLGTALCVGSVTGTETRRELSTEPLPIPQGRCVPFPGARAMGNAGCGGLLPWGRLSRDPSPSLGTDACMQVGVPCAGGACQPPRPWHPLRAAGRGRGTSEPSFLLSGAVGSSPRRSQGWCRLGAHQFLWNERLGLACCVLEQELKAACTGAGRPPVFNCPRLLLESRSADAKTSLGNCFACWMRVLQSCFLLSCSALRWAACPGGCWGAEELRAALLADPGCVLLLAGAGSPEGEQDLTACSGPCRRRELERSIPPCVGPHRPPSRSLPAPGGPGGRGGLGHFSEQLLLTVC